MLSKLNEDNEYTFFYNSNGSFGGAITLNLHAERIETTLNTGWEFTKGSPETSTKWQQVRVPHDWAIYRPLTVQTIFKQ